MRIQYHEPNMGRIRHSTRHLLPGVIFRFVFKHQEHVENFRENPPRMYGIQVPNRIIFLFKGLMISYKSLHFSPNWAPLAASARRSAPS